MSKNYIKDFYGRILGSTETDYFDGRITLKDFYGKVLGTYDPKSDMTKDFYGRIIGHGNMLTMLLPSFDEQRKN